MHLDFSKFNLKMMQRETLEKRVERITETTPLFLPALDLYQLEHE